MPCGAGEKFGKENPVRPAERRDADNLYYYYNYNYCPAQFTDGVTARWRREAMASAEAGAGGLTGWGLIPHAPSLPAARESSVHHGDTEAQRKIRNESGDGRMRNSEFPDPRAS